MKNIAGFSVRLRQVIDSKGITPYELSARTNVSQATLSRILGDLTTKPSAKTVDAIANYLQVSKVWLLTGEGEMFVEEVENKAFCKNLIEIKEILEALQKSHDLLAESLAQNARLIGVIERMQGISPAETRSSD